MIYLQFGSSESEGLSWLKFIESHDKIMKKLHVLEQFSAVFCESRDSLISYLWVPEKKYEYMKQDSQLKKSLITPESFPVRKKKE